MRQREATVAENLLIRDRRTPNRVARFLRNLLKSKSAVLGVLIVLTVVILAIAAPVLSPHDPYARDITRRLLPPNTQSGETYHALGTDALGRDILSRLLYGARISLIVGLISVILAGSVGVVLGLLSGFYGGHLSAVIMRAADIQLTLPFMVLAIAVAAALGPGLRNIIIVLAVTGWPIYARVVRSDVLSVINREYVEAARTVGNTNLRIIWRHILPNVTSAFIVVASLLVARMVIAEASLSFLGLGVQPPTATWGGMIADGRGYMSTAWWVSALPGIALLVTIIGVNLLGDWLRDTLDPQLRPL